ncbi:MAG: hypothetical protein A2X04_07815 [Bacteroidetes bacterium GWF2_41_9]|nr:MAG: hypothetical protein A2X03_16055 [Bacteroidetes bacterium GWA2_40_15]OFX94050.1 MAG: hypothetical protein A2X06_14965 [Bacteroidetes bacterium GWC2_40_22]OFY59571.1 MAG: hypothetical protein A2X04_07815 [Bacteroidetes bacterium GWF2_41_9]HAM11134.1 hypothetical protein [Bacteroidales bacterium]HBH85541.1 hypothetical protein [Bacteroidales bacterium]
MNNPFTLKGLIFFVLLLSFTGCEKDNEDPNKLLIGTWNQVSTHIINYYDNVKTSDITNTYSMGEYVLEVYDNGTASRFHNGKIAGSYYWSVEGDILILTWDTGVVQKNEYSVDDTSLTLRWAVVETIDGHTARSEYESSYNRE